MLKLLLALGSLTLCAVSTAIGAVSFQDSPIKQGEIIEQLICKDDPDQSYALYLPTNYTPDRVWPMLYAFDPGARGKVPIERFKAAAEQYGWIVAGSNNSRNGSIAKSMEAARAMWKDTHQRFAIAERQTYLTGFSGGARVAIYLASVCHDCVAGVIACGAGFPAELKPSAESHFVIFGTAGIDDFNFQEIRNLREAMTRAGVISHIQMFGGRHEWPPPALAREAIEWLILQAIRSRAHPRDDVLIE